MFPQLFSHGTCLYALLVNFRLIFSRLDFNTTELTHGRYTDIYVQTTYPAASFYYYACITYRPKNISFVLYNNLIKSSFYDKNIQMLEPHTPRDTHDSFVLRVNRCAAGAAGYIGFTMSMTDSDGMSTDLKKNISVTGISILCLTYKLTMKSLLLIHHN